MKTIDLKVKGGLTDREIQRIMQSPEFMPELLKQGKDVKIEAEKIPKHFANWVLHAIKDVPFSETKLPLEDWQHIYTKQPIEWTITTVQKMANMVIAVKPSIFTEYNYQQVVAECVGLHNECARIIKELQEKTIQTLYNRERLSGKI